MTRDEELTALAGFLDHFRRWARDCVFDADEAGVDADVQTAWLTAFDKATDRLLYLTGQPLDTRAAEPAPRPVRPRPRLRVV